VDLGELIRVSVGALQPEADQRGITVTVGETDASVDADPELLERLTMNLVQNAIRHNRAYGQAWVSCATTPDAVVLQIANTGPSVPEERIQELFEPFRRGTARVGSPRGHGLGLSIVRAVALAHGGSISARPCDGGGLVVVVTLPRGAGQHSGGAQPGQRS
jgi:signal transduction histidine kinase